MTHTDEPMVGDVAFTTLASTFDILDSNSTSGCIRDSTHGWLRSEMWLEHDDGMDLSSS